ncbi:MAG: hypothetical protein JXL97_14205 [Bacteroidales bacterium]|nr:hypothetical protein [Bacteroidales bacterium]
MNKIKTWTYNNGFGTDYIAELFEDKIVVSTKFNKNEYKNEYFFKSLFGRQYPLVSVEKDNEIFKEVVKLSKPDDLTEFQNKKWSFWSAIDNSKIKDERIFIDEARFLFKSKFGFAEGYLRYDKKEMLSSWQSIDNFFFYGPYLYGVSRKDRLRLREEIFGCLSAAQHNITLEDSYLIFDYDKIEEINFEHVDGIAGVYFKIIDGKVIVGGWDNPHDGGENYTSVEYLWYNMKTRVPIEFHDKLDLIKSALTSAISKSNQELKVNQIPSESSKEDKRPSRS